MAAVISRVDGCADSIRLCLAPCGPARRTSRMAGHGGCDGRRDHWSHQAQVPTGKAIGPTRLQKGIPGSGDRSSIGISSSRRSNGGVNRRMILSLCTHCTAVAPLLSRFQQRCLCVRLLFRLSSGQSHARTHARKYVCADEESRREAETGNVPLPR